MPPHPPMIRPLQASLAFLASIAVLPAQAPDAAPPVTVSDLIGLTWLGSQGAPAPETDFAVVAPDQVRVAVVTQRGNLATNTRDFALRVLRLDAPPAPTAQPVAR